MKSLLPVLTLLLLMGCSKDAVQPTFCYECQYHEEIWRFCDMTESKIDSIQAAFKHNECDQDTLICRRLAGEYN